ncbi:aspartate/glutamate racemase family protein [Neptunomonas antarctica]|uniref:Aspartate racemase n=1 Tax=Neptunomonas antarctica TaxID=619304 RepID=A0A1N7L1A7_9GAMM|nr:amino acid racemase [Neptunomonas antarctica]SIS67639.1 aspartate racemase [Neptunomonas antarctica]
MSIKAGNEKIVGVIGGMGPEATVELMRLVIAATPAKDDIDHIRMLVDNNPKVPSRIKAIIEGTGESPVPCMIGMALGLEKQGADFLVIPCNTAHHYYPDVAAAVNIPVFNLIELTSQTAKKEQPDLRKAGLLASSALQKIHLYEPWFDKHDVQVLYPQQEDQQAVMDLIRAVKAKNQTVEQIQAYNRAARNLADQGAQCLILACTELSIIGDQLQTVLPVYDTSTLLAQAIVSEVLGSE